MENNPCNNVDNGSDNDEEVEISENGERGLPVLSDDDIDEVKVTSDQLLRESDLKVFNLETVCRWMQALGFEYEAVKNHFHVDCHEKPEVKAYQDNEWILR